MNTISLIGRLSAEPVYYCTTEGRDLTRFQLRNDATEEGETVKSVHHCQAWGPAALDLHKHLTEGEQLLVRGELRYRERQGIRGGVQQVPFIYVKEYTYLG